MGGVAGLHLDWRKKNSISWILRTVGPSGKRSDFGLGSFPEVSLARAREMAASMKEKLREGIDPRDAKRRALSVHRADALRLITFKEAAEDCWKSKSHEFSNPKHAAQWINTLREYAYPTLGDLMVHDIQRAHVLAVLKPIWLTKTDTAKRLRGRIEASIAYAYSLRDITDRPNPAVWKDGLDKLLPSAQKLLRKKKKRHPALPWKQLPEFMAALIAKQHRLRLKPATGAATGAGMGLYALQFQLETTTRSGEVRFARWSEIDLAKAEWSIPGERIKGRPVEPHIVPLSESAVRLLKSLPRLSGCDFIFPSSKDGPLSDATIAKVIKDMHAEEIAAGRAGWMDPKRNKIATPHGTARSSFKDWARNMVGNRYADEVSEVQLSHGINADNTRSAYARDDLLEKRRLMMRDYSQFLHTPADNGNVIPLQDRGVKQTEAA